MLATPAAATECRPWAQSGSAGAAPLSVGEIDVRTGNVFDLDDPAEGTWLHVLANNLHVGTRDSVLEPQLLFATGEPYRARALHETERRIRANPYIHRVSVEPVRVCGERVDVRVETTDNWSLTPAISIGRRGGFTYYSYKIEEANLLGFGKHLSLAARKSIDRRQNELSYSDRHLFNSRHALGLRWQDNSDGGLREVTLTRPFYGFTGNLSWEIEALGREYRHSAYRDGEIAGQLDLAQDRYALRYGWSDGLADGAATRYGIGWTWEDTGYTGVDEATSPPRRVLSYPSFTYQYVEERFIERTNLQSMETVEDVAIGHDLEASLGWSSSAFDANLDALVLAVDYRVGVQPGRDHLGLLDIGAGALLGESGVDNGELRLTGRWYVAQSVRDTSYFSADLMLGDSLFPENEYTLGGDSGLRGYPLRIQSGDRRYLLSAEQRRFFDWYPLRLVRLGAALFADAGAAWFDGQRAPRALRDVGFGLRLVSTRQTGGKVLHVDFAFPLDARERVDSFQLVVEAKGRF